MARRRRLHTASMPASGHRLPYNYAAPPRPRFEPIPRLFSNQTIVCMGSGPSLCMDDVRLCYAHARILAVNDAWRLTGPQADVLFGPDAEWWKWRKDDSDTFFPWQLWTLDPEAVQWRSRLHCVNFHGQEGIEFNDPAVVRTGGHGGYTAINIAVHLGAKKIVLLGYDMQPGPDGRNHFFGEHPNGHHVNYEFKLGVYAALPALLASHNIEIVNASRVTAIPYIKRVTLEEALQ